MNPNRRPPLWRRVEIISLSLVGFVLLATFLSAWRDWNSYTDFRDKARASRAIVNSIHGLLASLLDAESAQRGYVLTQKRSYRLTYDAAIAALPAQLNDLRRLTSNDSADQADIAALVGLIDQKTKELRQTILLRDSSGFQAALENVQTGQGEKFMEQVRAVAQRVTAGQSARLTSMTSLATSRGARSWFISAGGDLLLGAMLIIASFVIMSASRRREELIAQLREDDRRLRELRAQAQAAEERSRNILESITDGFVSFDRDWSITYLNAEAETIFGRPRSELLGKNYWDEFPLLVNTEVETKYRQAAAGQSPVTFEFYLEDREAWWEENVYPGKDGAVSVYFRDVTRRKRMEERSRHSHKLESLGVLAGGVAHDFNNLLTAILGSATLAMDDIPSRSAAAEHIGNVIAASERAAQLTRQMLAYSGRGRFVVESLDLSRQVREITALLQASVKRNVELILNLEDSGACIEADAGQLNQLVMNLVINGAEAIGGNSGSVVVSTRLQELDADYVRDNMAGDEIAPGHYILLEIHDTGVGMDRETIARIFDPFFTTKFTGRGLGLAAVLGIVRGHKGAIKVYSHVGQGTTFKVFLPVTANQAAIADVPARAPDLRGSATILVVDDEDVVLNMARSTLTRYGYDVLVAVNGREAVDIFRQNAHRVSVVLLDMTMPVLSGEETLKELRQIRSNIQCIASSGYNEIEALRRFGGGVCGFLQKPYRAAQLAEKVKASVESATRA